MEKTNNEIVFELLSVQPLRSGEIEERSSIPKTTLFRILNNLVDNKIIRKVDGLYQTITPTPSIESINDKMMHYHQQKLMDYKYRRMDRDKQLDIITDWFIESPSNLKGKIDDYIFDELVNNITKASLQLKSSL
jgi:DNA-binding HxlR family transcriptional regulator